MAATIDYGVDAAGVDSGILTVNWEPVHDAEDGSEMDIQGYVIETSPDAEDWKQAASAPSDATSVVIRGLLVPSAFWVRVRVIGVNGMTSEPSEVEYIELIEDIEPPPVPHAPTLVADLGVLTVTWDGLFTDGDRPSDFFGIQVHVGATADFVPSAATLRGTMADAGSLPVGGLGYGTVHARLVAVDRRRNASEPSPAATATLEPLVLTGDMIEELDGAKIKTGTIDKTKIGDDEIETRHIGANQIVADNIASQEILGRHVKALEITGDKIAANTIKADNIKAGEITSTLLSGDAVNGKTITGAFIRSAESGARWEGDIWGLRLYNPAGTNTINLDATTGEATLTGQLSTGAPATSPRIEISRGAYFADAQAVRPTINFFTTPTGAVASLSVYRDQFIGNELRLASSNNEEYGVNARSRAVLRLRETGSSVLESRGPNYPGTTNFQSSWVVAAANSLALNVSTYTQIGSTPNYGGVGSSLVLYDRPIGSTDSSNMQLNGDGTIEITALGRSLSPGSSGFTPRLSVAATNAGAMKISGNGQVDISSQNVAGTSNIRIEPAGSIYQIAAGGGFTRQTANSYVVGFPSSQHTFTAAGLTMNGPTSQTGYDSWETGAVTGQTINGVSGVRLDWAYRMTYDRTVDLRVMFTFPTAPASQQIVYSMPAAIPRPDTIPGANAELSYPSMDAAAHAGNLRTPIGSRWASTGNLIFHGPASGNTATVIKATGTYTTSK